LNIVLYSEGAFSYTELEQYPMRMIADINEAMKEKNEKAKEAMQSSKVRKTF